VPGRSSQSEVQRPVAASDEQNGEISPNGNWIAYQSDESGPYEVYVRPFPNVGTGQRRVSTGGGTRPLWARNGKELFYVAPTGLLMAVGLELGANVVPGNPVKLLEARYFMGLDGGNVAGRTVGGAGRTYDVSLDGQRFLMIKSGVGSEQGDTPPSIVVVQNWLEELKRLAPSK
jgi:serine/threonine-protein kinase